MNPTHIKMPSPNRLSSVGKCKRHQTITHISPNPHTNTSTASLLLSTLAAAICTAACTPLRRRCLPLLHQHHHQHLFHHQHRTLMTTPKRRFIIDCDPGVDDAIALLLAISEASRLQDQILAVTTVHGNVNLPQTTKNAAKTLDLINVKTPYFESRRIPIHPGCASPFIKTDKVYFPWHG